MKSIEEILATDDAHHEDVEIKEWEATLRVYSMSAEERSDIEKLFSGKATAASDPGGFRAAILQRSLKKDDGKTPLGTPDQIKLLMKKNAECVERLFEAACRVSGFTKKDVKELEKN